VIRGRKVKGSLKAQNIAKKDSLTAEQCFINFKTLRDSLIAKYLNQYFCNKAFSF